MAVIESPTELQPYLDPGYWNGHMLGLGDTQLLPSPLTSRRSRRLAACALEKHLSGAAPEYALHIFRDGDTFNAATIGHGGIVLFGNETLQGPVRDVTVPAEGTTMPDRPTNLLTDFGTSKDAIHGFLDSETETAYSRVKYWGVVVRSGREHRLFAVPFSSVDTTKGPRVVQRMKTALPSFVVGTAAHYVNNLANGTSIDFISRINTVWYVRQGTARLAMAGTFGDYDTQSAV